MNEKEMAKRFRIIRHYFEEVCTSLQMKNNDTQLVMEASPSKWLLAHATWFFEAFVLQAFLRNYRPFHPCYGYLFDSYYNHADHERKGEIALCK